MKNVIKYIFVAVAAMACASVQAGVIIDVNFSAGTGTNPAFTEIDNGLGGGGTWDQSSGLVTRGAAETSTVGASSTTVFDPSSMPSTESLVMHTVVGGTTGVLNYNGLFIGFQRRTNSDDPADGSQLYNKMDGSFGLKINSDNVLGAYSRSAGNVVTAGLFGSAATQASIDDGFEVTMTINEAGWGFAITGLEDSSGRLITGRAGLWADRPMAFSEFTAATHAGFATQGGDGNFGTLQFESINLSQVLRPERARVFLLAGQSNMAGLGANSDLTSPYDTAQDNVAFWHNGAWVNLAPGFGYTTAQFGPEVSFGSTIK